MNPAKVAREQVEILTDLPNIGKAMAADLHLLGIHKPSDLTGQNPYTMYERLCAIGGSKHDLCVLDVFISSTDFMNGKEPQPWWHYTAERKHTLANQST